MTVCVNLLLLYLLQLFTIAQIIIKFTNLFEV